MRNYITFGYNIYKQDGFFKLIKRSFEFFIIERLLLGSLTILYNSFIRPITPTIGLKTYAKPQTQSKIVGAEKKLLDDVVEKVGIDTVGTSPPTELGLQSGHIALTQRGDDVIVIGGGRGISAITAVRQVGENGSIIIYDCLTGENHSDYGVKNIETNANLNSVGEICEPRHALVGEQNKTVELYERKISYDVPQLSPADLPDCDILEFDCNGLEYEIISNMEIRPRGMIIEVEAPFYKEAYSGEIHPRAILDTLDNLGYSVIQYMGHNGKPLNKKEFLELVDLEYETENKQTSESGANDSPIILVYRNS